MKSIVKSIMDFLIKVDLNKFCVFLLFVALVFAIWLLYENGLHREGGFDSQVKATAVYR